MKLDILAIGAHPDDVELSCGGTILNEIKVGKKVGIIDLTESELSSRGSVALRKVETEKASQILGICARENLKMRDGFFENNEENKLKLIKAIRKYQPEIVLGNIQNDRHPDHSRAGMLINESCFLAGLVKVNTYHDDGTLQKSWRPKYCLQYIQDTLHEPDFLIDITNTYHLKIQAIQAYSSQFFSTQYKTNELETYISTPHFFENIKAKDMIMGKKIGVPYAEGFISAKKIGLSHLGGLILQET